MATLTRHAQELLRSRRAALPWLLVVALSVANVLLLSRAGALETLKRAGPPLPAERALRVGQVVRAFELTSFDGKTVSVPHTDGRTLLF